MATDKCVPVDPVTGELEDVCDSPFCEPCREAEFEAMSDEEFDRAIYASWNY